MDNENEALEVEADDIFAFSLPPVTETDTGYIDESATASPEAGDSAGELEPDTGEAYRGMLDDKGVGFDPSIHSAPPEKTPSGRWKRIPKREREQRDGNETTKIEPNAAAAIEAQKMASLYGALHAIPFGSGAVIEKTEIIILADSIERYFNANGITQTPPGLDVALSAGLYSLGVSQRPSNVEKTTAYMKRAAAWFKVLFQRKKSKPKTETKTDANEETEILAGERAPDA